MLTFALYPDFREKIEMRTSQEKHSTLAEYTEAIQSQGKYWLTKKETVKALGITEPAFNKAAHRMIKHEKLIRIRNGFYVIIPPEFRVTKGPPPSHYIDALMKFHEQPYYVGVLSAASLHGASHQSPQEFQVVTSQPLSKIEVGQTRIRFITKKDIENTPTIQVKTPTGYMKVSTKAATILDLLRYVRLAGHLDNVATAIVELMESVNVSELLKIAKGEKELSYVQRLGFLIDKFSENKIASRELHELVEKKRPGFIFLRPDKRTGVIEKNLRWNILVNTSVEPDL
jgi:predicted transcriptional regulator of viral defense system